MKASTILVILAGAALFLMSRQPVLAPAAGTGAAAPPPSTGLKYRNKDAELISSIGGALAAVGTSIAGFWKS